MSKLFRNKRPCPKGGFTLKSEPKGGLTKEADDPEASLGPVRMKMPNSESKRVNQKER